MGQLPTRLPEPLPSVRSAGVGQPDDVAAEKAALRREMRAMRRRLGDRGERSRRIWEQVVALDELATAHRVLAFTSIPGEPDTTGFLSWCLARGKEVAVPEDGVDATWPDVVIVPGVAFTADGLRLGQGGGWYDRFLSTRPEGCRAIGVCFGEQLVGSLPVEEHDVRVDRVVSDGAVGDRAAGGRAVGGAPER